jgi:plasmid replication initiation protein
MPSRKKINVLNKQEKEELIVQHNNLIEARYHLTLQEKRLMYWLSSQVKTNDEDFKEHELSIKKFAEVVDIKGDHLYRALDSITHKLMQKIITIKSVDETEFVKLALLGGVKYLKNKGIIKLSFHPYLKPYMLQVKERFTKISLGDVMGLRSVHTIRVYELLKQYETIGKRGILLIDLREYCGIEATQYKKFNNFKKDILERAKREINEKTDILIDYEEIKTSRKITSIKFTIKPNPKYNQTEIEKIQLKKADIIQKELRSELVFIERMSEYGFSKQTAKKLLEGHGEEVLENALKAVNLQVQKSNVKNPKAMLLTAIHEKWKPDVYKKKKL